MRKRIFYYLFLLIIVLFSPKDVLAENKIYNIDMNIYISDDGTAKITEVWDVLGNDGTEWYKVMDNLGNSELSNFKVLMDDKPLKYKNWNVDESLNQKKGYYGINYTHSGMELCFGKYDYNRHKFTLSYTLSNYIINTTDSQVLYWNLIDKLSNVDFQNFSVTISSFYEFPDTLDVWGTGYKGYAYVKDGKISMSNEEYMNDSYVVLLAKFPLDTFSTDNYKAGYDTFDDIYQMYSEGTFEYNYDDDDNNNNGITYYNINNYYSSNKSNIWDYIMHFSYIGFIMAFIGLPITLAVFGGYGYKDNKKIDKKNVPLFRDIPCNKNIFYAQALIYLNNFSYNETSILGAIILKWVRNNKVVFKNQVNHKKEVNVIDLTMNPTFDNNLEQELFNMMYEASGDGILETKELERWCRKNYSKFFNLFSKINKQEIEKLKNEGHIYKRTNKKECRKKNVMDDMIYQDSVELYGLKKFLQEFSRMNTKEVLEVHLWDEYLMFAYLFGMADKVAKQLKNMYPEVIEKMQDANIDFNTIMLINNMSARSVSAASSARSSAESYSAGGGGFSTGGGGGGSFGGGGGGSR